MSMMSELDADKPMKLLMLRLDAIEQILIEDLKIPKERMEEVFMDKFHTYLTRNKEEVTIINSEGEVTT